MDESYIHAEDEDEPDEAACVVDETSMRATYIDDLKTG